MTLLDGHLGCCVAVAVPTPPVTIAVGFGPAPHLSAG
jgi:hypothetical protein